MPSKYALILATSSYHDNQLDSRSNASDYASQFADLLRNPDIGNFDSVITHTDCTSTDALKGIITLFRDKSPDDTVLLYIISHILIEEDELYFAFSDTELDFLDATTINDKTILRAINTTKSCNQIIILDCFFELLNKDVSAKKSVEARLESIFVLPDNKSTSKCSRTVISAMSDYVNKLDVDDDSRFTSYLIDGLQTLLPNKNEGEFININALYDYAIACINENNVPQIPQQWRFDSHVETPAIIKTIEIPKITRPSVFFSYKREDEKIVQQVFDEMQLRGVKNGWIDLRRLLPGEDWSDEIDEALNACTHMILFVSKQAMFSHVIAHEVSTFEKYVNSGEKEKIIPVILEEPDFIHDDNLSQDTSLSNGDPKRIQACQTIQGLVRRINWLNPTPLEEDYENTILKLAQELPKVGYSLGEMVHIPAGEFIMGEQRQQKHVNLADYWIGKWVVTVAEFSHFVRALGLNSTKYFPSAFDTSAYRHHRTMSYWPSEDLETYALNHPQEPMRGLTWLQANAYCDWLNKVLDEPDLFRLPSQAEWEKASRGTMGYKYPWGNEWKVGVANTLELGHGMPIDCASLGTAGDSPYGCQDMAGNIWEWTMSLPFDNDYDYKTLMSSDMPRAIRGGDWNSDRSSTWTYSKTSEDIFPQYFQRSIGLRLVATRNSEYFTSSQMQ